MRLRDFHIETCMGNSATPQANMGSDDEATDDESTDDESINWRPSPGWKVVSSDDPTTEEEI